MRNLKGKKVVLYARVSTTEQKDNGYRLPQQKKYLHEFAERNEMEIVEYFEEDHTATTFDRPVFNKMSKFIFKNNIDYVFFYKWDRFTREPDGIIKVDKWLAKGIEPNSITEWVNYNDASYYLYVGMFILQAKVENKKRGDATREGILGANLEGRHVNKPPIGYLRGKDPYKPKKPLMKPCLVKSQLIRQIFDEYATGLYSQESLRKKYLKKGISRTKSQFSNMLSNIRYAGKIPIAKQKNEPAKIIDGLHDAIVDEITFLKVQQVKFGRSNVRLNSKKSTKHEELLPLRGGVLKCSKCGSNLTGSPSKSRNGNYHYYYHCNSKKGCKERFSVKLAHNELEKILISLKPYKEVLELFKEILVDEYKSNQSNRIFTVKKLKKQKIQIEEKLDNLTEKFVIDSIDNESYNRLKNKYNNQISDLIINIDEHSGFHKDINKYADFGVQLLTNLSVFYKKATTEIKRKIIGSIFCEKLVFEDKKYRTAKFNEAIALIFNNSKGLTKIKNKKRHSISKVSCSVAGTGLEPVTFGL